MHACAGACARACAHVHIRVYVCVGVFVCTCACVCGMVTGRGAEAAPFGFGEQDGGTGWGEAQKAGVCVCVRE